jgi:hypothetical protein
MNWVPSCKKKCDNKSFFPIGGLSNMDDPPHFFQGFRFECQAEKIIFDEGRFFANEIGSNA